MCSKGFTLIEALVYITLLAVLLSVVTIFGTTTMRGYGDALGWLTDQAAVQQQMEELTGFYRARINDGTPNLLQTVDARARTFATYDDPDSGYFAYDLVTLDVEGRFLPTALVDAQTTETFLVVTLTDGDISVSTVFSE